MDDRLPIDVIIDILTRLSVKTLLRLKCVSKSWHDMIDDPSFVKLHLKRSVETDSRNHLIIESYKIISDSDLSSKTSLSLYSIELESLDSVAGLCVPLLGSRDFPSVVGSCNGLLCLRYNSPNIGFLLFNPKTRHYKTLKPTPPLSGERKFSSRNVGHGVFGFGYHRAFDDFKVVRIVQVSCKKGLNNQSVVDIYSMNSDSWTRVKCLPCPIISKVRSQTPVLVNDVLHWLGFEYDEPGSYSVSMIGFSLVVQGLVKIQLPPLNATHHALTSGVLRGCLLLVHHHMNNSDVWIMEIYGVESSWIKLHSMPSIYSITGSYVNIASVAFSRNGRELYVWVWNTALFSYDIEEKSFKQVGMPPFLGTFSFAEIVPCVESLVQPKAGCCDIRNKMLLSVEERTMRKKSSVTKGQSG